MAKLSEIMTPNPTSAALETPITRIAEMMANEDVGLIPITENENGGKLIGVITDRDIVLRVIAQGKNPSEVTAKEAMSGDLKRLTPESSVEEVTALMEEAQIRRVPIVDVTDFSLVGIVSMADLARHDSANAGEAIVQISQPEDSETEKGSITSGTIPM